MPGVTPRSVVDAGRGNRRDCPLAMCVRETRAPGQGAGPLVAGRAGAHGDVALAEVPFLVLAPAWIVFDQGCSGRGMLLGADMLASEDGLSIARAG